MRKNRPVGPLKQRGVFQITSHYATQLILTAQHKTDSRSGLSIPDGPYDDVFGPYKRPSILAFGGTAQFWHSSAKRTACLDSASPETSRYQMSRQSEAET